MSNFPDWYTIDELGLESLCYFLRQEYVGKTVLIAITKVDGVDQKEEVEQIKQPEATDERIRKEVK